MPSINDAYLNALLADAAYVVGLVDGDTDAALEPKLRTRMTQPLSEFISQNFTVLVPIDTNDFTESGFDAVVWRRNSDNKLFVSMRGTELGNDWLADTDLALNGAARAQYVSMVNWWLQHTTAANAQATQIESSISGGFQLAAPAVGTGRLVGASSVIANGHSLGGHLASVFHRLFGANGRVAHTYTFNSGGFLPGSEFFFQQLEGLLGRGMGRYANGAEQTNYFAENGINVTTNQFWFSQVGTRVPVFNEEGTGVPNHLIYKLTDSLALIEAMSRLDSTLSFDRANQILSRTGLTANSLERAVDALQRMLLNPAAPALAISDIGDSQAARVAYHAALRDFSNSPEIAALADKLTLLALSAQTVGGYALAAQSDFGRFVELQQLSPFLISAQPGNESLFGSRLQSLHGTDFSAWSADTAARTAASPTNFTDSWYADRTQMLSRLLQANDGNHSSIVPRRLGDPQSLVFIQRAAGADRTLDLQINVGAAPSAAQNTNYVIFGSDQDEGGTDLSGLNRNDRIYGGRGNDQVFGLDGNDYLEGGQGADVVNGGDGHDQLYGGAGIDELIGGAGDDVLIGGADSDHRLEGGTGRDRLEGGSGFDNYQLSTSDTAVDTIFDADNAGRLFVDGTMIGAFTCIQPNLYESAGGLYRMAVLGDGGGTSTATLYRKSDNKTLANIIGIQGPTVLGYALPSPPNVGFPTWFFGSRTSDDTIHGSVVQGSTTLTPGFGQIRGWDGHDWIVGGTYSRMEIVGENGNDVLYDQVLAANDAGQTTLLFGGSGSDFLYGTGTSMTLGGGTGNDFISSARYNSAPIFTVLITTVSLAPHRQKCRFHFPASMKPM